MRKTQACLQVTHSKSVKINNQFNTLDRSRLSQILFKKQSLMDATIIAIEKYGVENITARKICSIAKMSHGTIHYHFGNVTSLIHDIYKNLCSVHIEDLADLEIEVLDGDLMIDKLFDVIFSSKWNGSSMLKLWSSVWHLRTNNRQFIDTQKTYNDNFSKLLKSKIIVVLKFANSDTKDIDMQLITILVDGIWLNLCLNNEKQNRENLKDLFRKSIKDYTKH